MNMMGEMKKDSYLPDVRQQNLRQMEKKHKVTHKTMKTQSQPMGIGTTGKMCEGKGMGMTIRGVMPK